jgi:cyclophilin family peptidyl-prolyl cis-trans isomerase
MTLHTRTTCLPWQTLTLAASTLLLSACGGGSGDAGTPLTAPSTVSSASADRLSYGRLSTFTIIGSNLASAVTFSATGCDGLVVLAGGSVSQQTVTCTPNKALSVRLAASVGSSAFYTGPALVVPKPRVTLSTTAGSVVIELEPAAAPITVDNFLAYTRAGFFDGTIFHRVIPGFMVQGGGFTGVAGGTLTAQTGLRDPITLESHQGLSNLRGTIAMARQDDPDFNSANSQFFVNTVANTYLDYASATAPGYAVFGTVVSGMAVVDAMSAVATQRVGAYDNVPVSNIVLQTAAQTR